MFFGSKKNGGQPPSDPKAATGNGKLDIQPLVGAIPVMGAAESRLQPAAVRPDSAPAAGPSTDPAVLAKIAGMRAKLHETFGKVALVLMTTPRYRNLSIAELAQLVLDPMMRDRVAIATAAKEGASVDGSLSGIAIWASVSEAVDAKIREQIRAGSFPVRLQPDDWNSGNINWLIDVIAPNQTLTVAVIASLRQVLPKPGASGEADDLRMHPIVARLVGAEALRRMGATTIKTAAEGVAAPPVDAAVLARDGSLKM